MKYVFILCLLTGCTSTPQGSRLARNAYELGCLDNSRASIAQCHKNAETFQHKLENAWSY